MQKEIIKWMTSLETIEDHLSNSTNQNCLRSIFSIHHQRKHHSKVAACLQATISLEGIAEKKTRPSSSIVFGVYQYHTLPSFLLLRKLQFAKISFTQECFLKKSRALSSANFGQGAKKQFFKKYTMYSEYKYIAGSKIQKESSYRRVSKYFT